MEAKFTPGPWVVDENLILSGDLRVADVYHMEPIKPGATDANARLIASAPDLLAACLQLSDVWNELTREDINFRESPYARAFDAAAGMAHEAIKKARGEA